jgi:hypothetical protein
MINVKHVKTIHSIVHHVISLNMDQEYSFKIIVVFKIVSMDSINKLVIIHVLHVSQGVKLVLNLD